MFYDEIMITRSHLKSEDIEKREIRCGILSTPERLQR